MKKIFLPLFCMVAVAAHAQNVGINTDGSLPETGVMLDVKIPTDKATTAPVAAFFQVKSLNTSGNELKLRLGFKTDATQANRYAFMDFPDFTASAPAYLNIALQPSGGNVGIGTTAPLARLHTYNTSPILVYNVLSDFAPVLTGNQASNLHGTWSQINLSSAFNYNCTLWGAVNRINLLAGQTGTVTATVGSVSDVILSNTSTLGAAHASMHQISNSSTGTISNAYALYAGIYNSGGGTISNSFGIYINNVQGTNKWSLYANDAAAPSYFAGNVGIGTSAPAALVDIKGVGGTMLRMTATANRPTLLLNTDVGNVQGAVIGYQKQGVSTFAIYEYTGANKLAISDAATGNDAFSIMGGKTTIGNGSGISGGSSCNIYGNMVIGLTYYTAAAPASGLLVEGNVGIGTQNPSYKLEVCGTIGTTAVSVTTGIACSSDLRFKKNIQPLQNPLQNILSLRGVNYDWRVSEFPKKNFTNDKQIGFIAQELEKVFPEMVFTDSEGYKSVDYSRLTPVLVEAIKEQQKQIDELRSELLKMKAEISVKTGSTGTPVPLTQAN